MKRFLPVLYTLDIASHPWEYHSVVESDSMCETHRHIRHTTACIPPRHHGYMYDSSTYQPETRRISLSGGLSMCGTNHHIRHTTTCIPPRHHGYMYDSSTYQPETRGISLSGGIRQ